MKREYYSDTVAHFLDTPPSEILGKLVESTTFTVEPAQRDAWIEQVRILRAALAPYRGGGSIYFEYAVPRLGKRIDVIAIIESVVFVLEFKVGEKEFASHSVDQVWDYALDLKNFHESSHECQMAPVLIATEAPPRNVNVACTAHNDGLFLPIRCNASMLAGVIQYVLKFAGGQPIDAAQWELGRYRPTPTIIEAATALYRDHSVEEIARKDADATNLTQTSDAISEIIESARGKSEKAICFVTGVPGAGKTLVGLDIATKYIDTNSLSYSVFLSGNGPLVEILREALARDKVRRAREEGGRIKKSTALSEVKMFIQNVHHFRDECLVDPGPPIEHVALFDEAQRAWNAKQTSDFMRRKKKVADFSQSEPEFLISCLNRHDDWAVIVCLVGGGQEINTGEAGISEWIESLGRSFPDWRIFISSRLTDSEYAAGGVLQTLLRQPHVTVKDELHLGVSMRSFRAEHVSTLVKQVLDLDTEEAQRTLSQLADRYPIVITRSLTEAKKWVKRQARGSERYGLVVSSEAQRLKPYAIDVKSPTDPVHWFLDGKEDVRSSFYLEDVATEFQVQGLELDWACVTWDADFRRSETGWEHWSFCGDRWNRIQKPERQTYLKNAYRVILTRARQGMVVVVPEGDANDHTRKSGYYDPTFEYLRKIGFSVI